VGAADPPTDAAMTTPQCGKCLKLFRDPYNLKRHQARATPCTLILEAKEDSNGCKYCGRQFATKQTMQRHIKQSCKVANSPDGMEALFHHTVQKQLTKQEEQLVKQERLLEQCIEQKEEISELKTLIKMLAASRVQESTFLLTPASAPGPPSQVIINTTYNTQNNIVVQPWHGLEERIIIPAAMLRAAFTENPRLVEYCHLSDHERTHAENAIPYVLEALMDLVKRAHKEPAARNVYLNPKRADQVMVYDEATWKIIPLMEAISAIFDSVAKNITRITLSVQESAQLPEDVLASASMIPLVYRGMPDVYVKGARASMMAHLSNTAPLLL
jgi:hypothetical protein